MFSTVTSSLVEGLGTTVQIFALTLLFSPPAGIR